MQEGRGGVEPITLTHSEIPRDKKKNVLLPPISFKKNDPCNIILLKRGGGSRTIMQEGRGGVEPITLTYSQIPRDEKMFCYHL